MIGTANHDTYCGDPTLFVTMRAATSASESGPISAAGDAPRWCARIPRSVTTSTTPTMIGVSAAATASTPGPATWNVMMPRASYTR